MIGAPAGITCVRPGRRPRAFLRRTRTAGSSFVPSDIAGLQLWLKADGTLWQDSGRTTPVTSDSDPVGAWDDASGNGHHYTQSTSSSRPTYRTVVANSLPVLRFNGSDDYLTGPNHLSGLTAGTCFLVVKIVTDPPLSSGNTGLWYYGSAADSDHFPWTDGIIYDGWGSTTRQTVGDPTPSLSSAFRVYGKISASADWRTYLDGASLFATGTNTVGFNTTPTLGKSQVTSGNYFLAGDIAEYILYDSALNTTDRQSVEQYLSAKYALGF